MKQTQLRIECIKNQKKHTFELLESNMKYCEKEVEVEILKLMLVFMAVLYEK